MSVQSTMRRRHAVANIVTFLSASAHKFIMRDALWARACASRRLLWHRETFCVCTILLTWYRAWKGFSSSRLLALRRIDFLVQERCGSLWRLCVHGNHADLSSKNYSKQNELNCKAKKIIVIKLKLIKG